MVNKSIHIAIVFVLAVVLTLCSCGKGISLRRAPITDTTLTEKQLDSLRFDREHHYSENYNFVVRADSLCLLKQLPEEALVGMPTDTLRLSKGDHLVVADIHVVPTDVHFRMGTRVGTAACRGARRPHITVHLLLQRYPLCHFHHRYNTHRCCLYRAHIAAPQRKDCAFQRHRVVLSHAADAHCGHLGVVLCQFYFHPTLNPFVVEPVLAIFLVSVWAMLIVGLASVDVARHRLPFGEAVLYLCGLAAVCAADYIIFSVTTLWYVGYLLLVAYIIFAMWRYCRHARAQYVCGNCGQPMHSKGRCSACGAVNV